MGNVLFVAVSETLIAKVVEMGVSLSYRKNIGIGDCQLMYDKNFMPVIADPNKFSIGKDADKELVSKTIKKIDSDIKMIDFFVKNKKSYLETVKAKSKL